MRPDRNMRMNAKIVDEQKAKWPYRFRLIRIAAMLVVAIAQLAIIQWQIGSRGWDLSAGLLTIVMMTLGFGLVAVLLGILRGRSLTNEELTRYQYKDQKRFPDENWMEEMHRNDSGYLGSPYYRSLLDD